MANHKTLVSSRGIEIRQDPDQDRALIAAMTDFVCDLCKYPVLHSWQFCPNCGGMLEWSSIGENTNVNRGTA